MLMKNVDRLIIDVKNGNKKGFTLLYKNMCKAVYALALSTLSDKSLAEDAVHETFIRVKLMANTYTSGTNGVAWVLTITRNLCLNILKKRKFEVDYPSDDQSNNVIDVNALNHKKNEFENTLDKFILKEALSKLKEKERQIVILHSVSGLKHREIADLLDIPQATERWQYSSAIAKLRKLLINY